MRRESQKKKKKLCIDEPDDPNTRETSKDKQGVLFQGQRQEVKAQKEKRADNVPERSLLDRMHRQAVLVVVVL